MSLSTYNYDLRVIFSASEPSLKLAQSGAPNADIEFAQQVRE
ncbi:MAG: hypothetical protein PVH60_00165 [Anaerolineales bacterium]|jgi:hypothetical protein